MYRYIYKSVFRVFYRLWSNDYPEWNAAITLAIVICLNLSMLIAVLGLGDAVEQIIKIEIGAVIFFISIVFLNYLLFIHEDKYHKMVTEFKKETKKYSQASFLFGLAFAVLGYFLPIFMLLFNMEPVD